MTDGTFEGFGWPDFTMVPNGVFRRFLPTMTGGALKLLLVIVHACMYTNRDEDGRPERFASLSQQELMERSGMSRNTVRKALQECMDSGAVIELEPHNVVEQLAAQYSLRFRDDDPSVKN